MKKEIKKSPKDGAQRQREWKARQSSQGRTRRFDRNVTPEEYAQLAGLLERLRET